MQDSDTLALTRKIYYRKGKYHIKSGKCNHAEQILHTMTALVLALSVVIVGSQPVLALSVGEFFSIDYY
jgi:hypothetical protein